MADKDVYKELAKQEVKKAKKTQPETPKDDLEQLFGQPKKKAK